MCKSSAFCKSELQGDCPTIFSQEFGYTCSLVSQSIILLLEAQVEYYQWSQSKLVMNCHVVRTLKLACLNPRRNTAINMHTMYRNEKFDETLVACTVSI
jgi:hypothetical protein